MTEVASEPTLTQCPKCTLDFAEPVPNTGACPQCGVYFFKVDAAARAVMPVQTLSAQPLPPSNRAAWGARLVVASVALGALIVWQARGGIEAAPEAGDPAPVAAALPDAGDEPSQSVPLAAGRGAREAEGEGKDVIDPEIMQLAQTPDTVFDLREEVYRIANLNDLGIESIQFSAAPITVSSGDGSAFAAAAFAQPALRDGQRVCDVRVIRPTADQSYQPGAATDQLTNLRRRTTIAHELAHCADWYNGGAGWLRYRAGLPPARERLTANDAERRWREEFADVHAMVLLRTAFGAETARLAAKVRQLERGMDAPLWYRHAAVALASGEPLRSGDVAQSEAIVARYWGE